MSPIRFPPPSLLAHSDGVIEQDFVAVHESVCRLCEKSKTLDRDRTSYSLKAAFGAHTASPFNLEIEPENIILVALRLFEFPHSLGPLLP